MFKLKSKYLLIIILIITLILIFNQSLFSDTRTQNIDIVIALDKSLSMVEEIDAVKAYVNHYIIDQLIIPNDYLLVIGFYGKTDVLVSQFIRNKTDKEQVKRIIDGIKADGHFTDIGHALDVVKEKLTKLENDHRRKYVLLLTDGKQEAPPTSKYYSPTGKFNHEFLKNAKVIQKKGWKIEILGIGKLPETEELARTISGNYTEISSKPTEGEIKKKTKNLLSVVEITEKPGLITFSAGGRGKVNLTLKSSGYNSPVNIVITKVKIVTADGKFMGSSEPMFSCTINPGEKTNISIPIKISNLPAPGGYRGTITFEFGNKGVRFVPAAFDVSFRIKSFLESFWWLILVGILAVVILIIFLVRYIAGMGGGTKKMKLRVVVEELPVDKMAKAIEIREKNPLYLTISKDNISLSDKMNPFAVARLTLIGGQVKLSVLKEGFFRDADKISDNILNKSIKVKTDIGRNYHIKIRAVS